MIDREAAMTSAFWRFIGTLSALAVCFGAGAQQPKDCSAGPVPDKPLELSVASESLPVPQIVVLRRISTMTGEKAFDQYAVTVQDKDMFATTEIEFSVLVPKGQRVDGKTFRRLPGSETAKQPAAEDGLPEVQSWKVKMNARKLDASHVSFIASLRVEFGQRKGDMVPGKVYLCVPGGQTSRMFGDKLPDPITLVGRFEAKAQ